MSGATGCINNLTDMPNTTAIHSNTSPTPVNLPGGNKTSASISPMTTEHVKETGGPIGGNNDSIVMIYTTAIQNNVSLATGKLPADNIIPESTAPTTTDILNEIAKLSDIVISFSARITNALERIIDVVSTGQVTMTKQETLTRQAIGENANMLKTITDTVKAVHENLISTKDNTLLTMKSVQRMASKFPKNVNCKDGCTTEQILTTDSRLLASTNPFVPQGTASSSYGLSDNLVLTETNVIEQMGDVRKADNAHVAQPTSIGGQDAHYLSIAPPAQSPIVNYLPKIVVPTDSQLPIADRRNKPRQTELSTNQVANAKVRHYRPRTLHLSPLFHGEFGRQTGIYLNGSAILLICSTHPDLQRITTGDISCISYLTTGSAFPTELTVVSFSTQAPCDMTWAALDHFIKGVLTLHWFLMMRLTSTAPLPNMHPPF